MSIASDLPGKRGSILAWALYDWANSAFATVVMAGFFPIFFREYWSRGQASETITFHLGAVNSGASLVIALVAPVLGAMADRGHAKKRFLAAFTVLGILGTAGMFSLGGGHWMRAAALYTLGIVGYMGANIFYDALIVAVARPQEYDRVSALGYGLGYLGGGGLFAICVALTLWPTHFGLADAADGVRWSFLLTAIWWGVFTWPLLLRVAEPGSALPAIGWARTTRAGWHQLLNTAHEIRRLRVIGSFLLAYWLYIDGVNTVIRMAVNYALSLGFGSQQLIAALLLTQFVGVPAAIGFGYLGERIGTRTAILLGIGVYVLATIWAANMHSTWEFYAIAAVIGLVQGGVQSLSRALYARLIPAGKSGEFFGFYNMLGKFAAVIGPLLIGLTALVSDDARLSILSILLLFISGAILLWRLPLHNIGANWSDSETSKPH
ncbi:MFS transporter [Acidihalobacter yilgarnensis]|uniref:MFS transporter n=1 Tax=Acidihalobacter yilgarnensis TaxID=2819280 RepID=UPI000AC95319|nr:MFS transporter [Acidihalobacter yilgarnensis]